VRTSETDRAIEAAVERLVAARSLLFITGAEVSADSGLPTYRCNLAAVAAPAGNSYLTLP
jgi:hypothetical protein